MQAKIFFSWQSDIRAAACRSLIEEALQAAAKALVEDGTAELVPVIDRDTQDVAGCPDIGATILEKIAEADVFVADVTNIGRVDPGERPTPNPNVVFETGYAYGVLGPSRIILVLNKAYGTPEQLPFDLRQKRALSFESHADAAERSAERRRLTSGLIAALAPIIKERAKVHAGGDNNKMARWRKLLEDAKALQTWVEVDSAVEIDTGTTNASGRKVMLPAIIDNVRVWAVDEHTFDLGLAVRGRGGVTLVPTPFSVVHDIWDGKEGRVHVLLNRTIFLLNGTSRFI
jgi:hypothetical protein